MADIISRLGGYRETLAALQRVKRAPYDRKVLERIGKSLVASARRNIREKRGVEGPWPKALRFGRVPATPLIDTHALYESIDYRLSGRANVEAFSNDPSAAAHEYGMELESGARRMAIPLSRAFRNRSPRDIPNAFKKKLGSATYIVTRRAGSRSSQPFNLLYLLVESIDLPARHFIEPREQGKKQIDDLLADYIVAQWEKN